MFRQRLIPGANSLSAGVISNEGVLNKARVRAGVRVNMYCPNCGIETTQDRKFCRSCGTDLITVSRVLTGQLQVVEPGSGAGQSALPWYSHRRGAAKAGFIAFWGGILLAAMFGIIGSALENIDQSVGSLVASLAGLGGLVVLFGIGLMIYSLFLSKAPAYPQSPLQTRLPNSQPQAQLPPESYRQPVSSVTESTTRLFDEAEQRTKPRDGARRTE